MMDTVFWAAIALGGVSWTVFWFWAARLRSVPPALSPGRVDRLSVIIPARNERENLSRLLPSLLKQPEPPREIIVVDDHSDDGTGKYAREVGVRVIEAAELPEGWLGKPWACHQGAAASTGEWLLFLDADTEVQPGGLGRLAALAGSSEQVHSICPYHRVEKAYEQLSALFNVIMVVGVNAFTLLGPRAGRTGLFGQALLVARSQYEAVGGHERVRSEALENLALAKHFREMGAECLCWLGRDTIHMRMFPEGLGELTRSWAKGAISGASHTPASAVTGVSLWITAMSVAAIMLPVAVGAGHEVTWAAVLYAVVVLQAGYLFKRVGSYWWLGALFFPVLLVFYLRVFMKAAGMKKRGEQLQWKGRDVG